MKRKIVVDIRPDTHRRKRRALPNRPAAASRAGGLLAISSVTYRRIKAFPIDLPLPHPVDSP
jgi:hypothetical protein